MVADSEDGRGISTASGFKSNGWDATDRPAKRPASSVEVALNGYTNPSAGAVARPYATIVDAVDALEGCASGYRFFDVRGELVASIPFGELGQKARDLATRLAGRFERGARIALVAETSPQFLVSFFACQYAGLVPAPLPLPVNLGGKEGYLQQIRLMTQGSDAAAVVGPVEVKGFLAEAIDGLPNVVPLNYDELFALPVAGAVAPFGPDEHCYIQYSSGSTSAPKGVIGTQASVTANLHGITTYGLSLQDGDCAVSWLPLYHDMGLIGFALSPLYAGMGVDYLATSDFVRRPLMWLRLITQSRATITYSPSFGYELAARRAARAEDGAIDLTRLRVAGIGADMVRPEALEAFAEAFGPLGFDPKAFLPSYGMAEATLAITFTKVGEPLEVDQVDMRHFNRSGIAQPASAVTAPSQSRKFVLCGSPLPEHELQVRGDDGEELPDRVVGRIFIKGPSLTPGYFRNDEATEAMYHDDWLDTGDMGYMLHGQIVITGRAKDLIIINGRNIWPQDIEWAVEATPGARQNGVAAFSVDDGISERIVVVVERRGGMTAEELADMKRRVMNAVQTVAGAPAEVVLARPHSMVLTSSGKLSRAKMKAKYLEGAFETAAEAPAKAVADARI
ncbi:MAG: fatty acyl-AMP ligase [Alphaproteobacteria bacterium]|nr:fatty acyl-AMP ligase [Alphaproteobacteria bacterium]